jgi:hypothetical protein
MPDTDAPKDAEANEAELEEALRSVLFKETATKPVERRSWSLIFLALLIVVDVGINYYFIGVFGFVFTITAIGLLLTLLTICLLIIILRERHANHVYTLWFTFFFMVGCGFAIYVYLDKVKLIDLDFSTLELKVGHSVEVGFLAGALGWYLRTSIDLMDEVSFLFILVIAVVLPQILSFLISGLFGCGRSPIFVSSVTRFAFLSLIKLFCILSALSISEYLFILYNAIYHNDSAYKAIARSTSNLEELNESFLLLMISFLLSAIYYNTNNIRQYIPNHGATKMLERVWAYMTRYTAS